MLDPTVANLSFADDDDLLAEAIDRGLVAAGPWKDGTTPHDTGAYIVKMEAGDDHSGDYYLDVATYNYQPMGRGGWMTVDDDRVLGYAPIHT